jgi:heterodisulfide reductase subunit C
MCIGCACCEANCPSGVEMYEVMQVLREMAREEGVESNAKDIKLFNKLFLDTVKKNGRSHEIGLILKYNTIKKQYFKDVILGPKMFLSGMLNLGNLIPPKIENRSAVKKIFEKVAKKRGQN